MNTKNLELLLFTENVFKYNLNKRVLLINPNKDYQENLNLLNVFSIINYLIFLFNHKNIKFFISINKFR